MCTFIANKQHKKRIKKTVESDTDVSVPSMETSVWIRLQISLHGRKKSDKIRVRFEKMIMMDSGTTINLLEIQT